MQVTEPQSAAQPLEQVINSVRAAAEDWHLTPDDMIFLNGSRVEGFENQYSDVDIWLVSKSDPQKITSIPVFSWTDGLHINSSAYAESQMLALAALVNDISVEDHVQVCELPLNTLVRYYRVAVAASVINPDGLVSLQAHFSKEHGGHTSDPSHRCVTPRSCWRTGRGSWHSWRQEAQWSVRSILTLLPTVNLIHR